MAPRGSEGSPRRSACEAVVGHQSAAPDAIDATEAWEPSRRPRRAARAGAPRLTSCSVEAPLIVAGEGSRRALCDFF